jgi:DNA-directed RNA polymerase specialized sigma24 family protein
VHGVETDEVCNKLNISQANLYVRLHRARERVRMVVETVLG